MSTTSANSRPQVPSLSFGASKPDDASRYSQNPIEFINTTQARAKRGDVFKVNTVFAPTFWLRAPELNREFYETSEDVWSSSSAVGEVLDAAIGPEYLRHHPVLANAFRRHLSRTESLHSYQKFAEVEVNRLLAEWQEESFVDLFESVSKLVYGVLVQCFLGEDFYEKNGDELWELHQTILESSDSSWHRILPSRVPRTSTRTLKAARNRMQTIFQERIRDRQTKPEKWGRSETFLSRNLRDPTTRGLVNHYSDHHTFMVFVMHGSMATEIAWTLVELLKSPTRLNTLRTSLQAPGKVSESAYLQAILHETARHYSSIADIRCSTRSKSIQSASGNSQTAASFDPSAGSSDEGTPELDLDLDDDESLAESSRTDLGDKSCPTIPARSRVMISPYLTHHDHNLWALPNAWYPERWLEEPDLADRLNYGDSLCYLPSAVELYGCPSAQFTRTIARTVVPAVVSKVDMSWADADPAGREPYPIGELKFPLIGGPSPEGDVQMRFVPRRA